MFTWRRPKFEGAYCEECGKRFKDRREAREHAEITKHKVVLKYG